MTADVSCPRCHTGYWVTNPDAEPWQGCSECAAPECCCGEIAWLDGAVTIEVDGTTHRIDGPCFQERPVVTRARHIAALAAWYVALPIALCAFVVLLVIEATR